MVEIATPKPKRRYELGRSISDSIVLQSSDDTDEDEEHPSMEVRFLACVYMRVGGGGGRRGYFTWTKQFSGNSVPFSVGIS